MLGSEQQKCIKNVDGELQGCDTKGQFYIILENLSKDF